MTDPLPPAEVREMAPYYAPVLTATAHLMCSACQDVITNNPKARVGAICAKCAYVTCGKCTPGAAHRRYCERLAFAATPDLLGRVFYPDVAPAKDEEIQFDDGMKQPFQFLHYMADMYVFNSEGERQNYFERLRTPATYGELLEKPAPILKPGMPEPKTEPGLTLGYAAMISRPYLTAHSLGGSNADYLFAALALMAQPRYDTVAQLAVLVTYLKKALTIRAIAYTAPNARARELIVKEAFEMHRQAIIELSVKISREGHIVEYRGFPWEEGYRFEERVEMELWAHTQRKSLMNVAFYLHLFHTARDEADQWTGQGKYAKQSERPRPRLASTDLVLRIMGDPANPQFAVFRSAAGLYSLEDWAKGQMHPPAVARLADPKKAARVEDFSDGLVHRPAGTDQDVWHASLLFHWVEPEPRYAGAALGPLEGTEELFRLCATIDKLIDPAGSGQARLAAYAELTGIKWPSAMPLAPFVLTLARADLTL